MDQDTLPSAIIIASVITLFILYPIIKPAVRSADGEVERLLRILINMKGDEL